ncbi:phosphopantetheine-binding protein [Streptomyces sp. Da 82-17]|uniref:phosphopantetheine-binding protein n=1 Tax=Streptomyces sp. Da 82-17 TaxID=3377116 RepID=UPI0038D4E9B8
MSNDVEQSVRSIWQEVLSAPDGPSDATFFELQGQSISAVRIVARIADELGIEMDIGELFEDPDLETFARSVAARAKEGATP